MYIDDFADDFDPNIKICNWCGKKYNIDDATANPDITQYCSQKCYDKFHE